MSFRSALAEELAALPWMDGPTGRALVGVLAADHETASREVKDAVLMRDPALGPDDALPHHGRDRYILRAPIETTEAFRLRLSGAAPHDHWRTAGITEGFTKVFAPYGLDATKVRVLSNHEVGGYWDGNADWFSRVFFLLDSTAGYFMGDGIWDPAVAGNWAEDTSPEAATWDSNATVADINYFRQAVRLTKGEGAYPVAIAVWLRDDFGASLPDGYWDSPGTYDDGSLWSEGDGLEQPLYWTLGNVWGQDAWTGDGVDTWADGAAELVDLPEEERWIAFPGEED